MNAPPPSATDARTLDPPRLLVEGFDPRFPGIYRRWLRASSGADIALTRLRIATLRLAPRDIARLGRLRLVLAELSTSAWEVETHRALLDPGRGPVLRALVKRLQDGTLEVRSAPLAGWSPDFTVFHRPDHAPRALLGPHWLEPTPGLDGPRFAFAVGGRDARHVADRFARIWAAAYDVGPAVTRLLSGTVEALDRLTPPSDRGIVSAPQNRGVLPP
ncbi:MAG: hypothetical protein RLN75_04880 [Longimicrobiales bacterium]